LTEWVFGTITSAGTFTYSMNFHQEPDCDWTDTIVWIVSPYSGP
jgi:hypothetical protein